MDILQGVSLSGLGHVWWTKAFGDLIFDSIYEKLLKSREAGRKSLTAGVSPCAKSTVGTTNLEWSVQYGNFLMHWLHAFNSLPSTCEDPKTAQINESEHTHEPGKRLSLVLLGMIIFVDVERLVGFACWKACWIRLILLAPRGFAPGVYALCRLVCQPFPFRAFSGPSSFSLVLASFCHWCLLNSSGAL